MVRWPFELPVDVSGAWVGDGAAVCLAPDTVKLRSGEASTQRLASLAAVGMLDEHDVVHVSDDVTGCERLRTVGHELAHLKQRQLPLGDPAQAEREAEAVGVAAAKGGTLPTLRTGISSDAAPKRPKGHRRSGNVLVLDVEPEANGLVIRMAGQKIAWIAAQDGLTVATQQDGNEFTVTITAPKPPKVRVARPANGRLKGLYVRVKLVIRRPPPQRPHIIILGAAKKPALREVYGPGDTKPTSDQASKSPQSPTHPKDSQAEPGLKEEKRSKRKKRRKKKRRLPGLPELTDDNKLMTGKAEEAARRALGPALDKFYAARNARSKKKKGPNHQGVWWLFEHHMNGARLAAKLLAAQNNGPLVMERAEWSKHPLRKKLFKQHVRAALHIELVERFLLRIHEASPGQRTKVDEFLTARFEKVHGRAADLLDELLELEMLATNSARLEELRTALTTVSFKVSGTTFVAHFHPTFASQLMAPACPSPSASVAPIWRSPWTGGEGEGQARLLRAGGRGSGLRSWDKPLSSWAR